MDGSGTWQLQHAKARLSEVVRCAQRDGPQVITVHGSEVVVVVDKCEYDRLVGPRKTLAEVLRSSPLASEPVDLVDEIFGNLRYQPIEAPVTFD